METLPVLAATAGAYLLAGFVKGVIGLGLPTVAIGLLGLMMTPAQAAAILVVPSLVTNIWQFAAGGALPALLRRMWPLLTGICIGTFIGAVLLPPGMGGQATMWLGVALALYAVVGLFNVQFSVPPRAEGWIGSAGRDRHRRRLGCDRRVRHTGRALYPGAAFRPRPAGAGARPVVHGVDRHAGARALSCGRDEHGAGRAVAAGARHGGRRHAARASGARQECAKRRSGCGSSSACSGSACIWRCAGCCDRSFNFVCIGNVP